MGLIDRDAPMLATLSCQVSTGIGRRSPRGANMNSTLVLLIIAAVTVAFFWRAILKIGIAAIIVGFAFLLITSLLDILHGLQALLH
jgi:hypothetical protein